MSEPAFKQRSINILNVLIVTDSEGEDYCELNYSTFCQPVERTLFGDELVVIGGSGIFLSLPPAGNSVLGMLVGDSIRSDESPLSQGRY